MYGYYIYTRGGGRGSGTGTYKVKGLYRSIKYTSENNKIYRIK